MELDHWNQRKASLEEEREFQRLLSFAGLTHSWVGAISPESETSHRMERAKKVVLPQNMWVLEKLRLDDRPPHLEMLVGAQTIQEFLAEFSSTLWTIHTSHLENTLEQSDDSKELINLLEKTTWNYGKICCSKIWNDLEVTSLEEAYEAFLHSHFFGERSFILERKSPQELTFLWVSSPQNRFESKSEKTLEILQRLHEEWIMGFFYGLSRKIRISSELGSLDQKSVQRFTMIWMK